MTLMRRTIILTLVLSLFSLGTFLLSTHASNLLSKDYIVDISSGDWHNIILKKDGTVWAWGYNEDGRLGDGTIKNRKELVQVKGLANIKAISAGTSHSLALKEDGTVWAWGNNDYGKVGDGTTENRLTPVKVKGLTYIKAISAGSLHSLALKEDGTVWWEGGDGPVPAPV